MKDVLTQVLELTNVAGSQVISRQMANQGIGGQWTARALFPSTMDALVVTVCGYLAADHIETVKIAYPRDWWEAVKARFAPAWFVRRWPVRETRHEIRLDAVYPKMPLPEKFGQYIRIQRHTEPSWDMDES